MHHIAMIPSRLRASAIALLLACITLLSHASPARAQWVVSDPITEAHLTAMLPHAVAQDIQTAQTAINTLNQLNALRQQATVSLQDHLTLSNFLQTNGSSMLQDLLQNNNLMSTLATNNQNVSSYFNQTFPQYSASGNPNYQQYLRTLYSNSNASFGAALGVGDQALQNEQGIGQALQGLASTPPANQLQALQTMIAMSRLQSEQFHKMIMVQAAMLKTMNAYYTTALEKEQAENTDVSTAANIRRALVHNPFIGYGKLDAYSSSSS